eukprot:545193-Rhodomonas_salina.1
MQAEAASGEDRGADPARSRRTSQTAAPTRSQDEAWQREEGWGSEAWERASNRRASLASNASHASQSSSSAQDARADAPSASPTQHT